MKDKLVIGDYAQLRRGAKAGRLSSRTSYREVRMRHILASIDESRLRRGAKAGRLSSRTSYREVRMRHILASMDESQLRRGVFGRGKTL